MLKKLSWILAFVITATGFLCAQQQATRPSPPANASCELPGGKSITVKYSSPRMKGRKIYGGLVPYGQVWRTGANEATTFETTENLVAPGGVNIPAGNYTMFTLPKADGWTLIINKHTGEWGIPYKYESEELARIPMQVKPLSSPVENFTIAFDKSATGCTMHLTWENTDASVTFNTKNSDMPMQK